MIEDRNLKPGTVLVGTYKGTEYRAKVVAGEGDSIRFRLADGRTFKSINAITMAIGCQANGWTWWNVAPRKRRAKEISSSPVS